jgi:hypothetical protein
MLPAMEPTHPYTQDAPLTLRSERQGSDRRSLWAWVDDRGDLHVDGQDLGAGTSMVSDDGEYEWYQTIDAADLPALVLALGGPVGAHVLDVLAARYTGEGSYELERILREGVVPVARMVW